MPDLLGSLKDAVDCCHFQLISNARYVLNEAGALQSMMAFCYKRADHGGGCAPRTGHLQQHVRLLPY